jgi:hypothetical protein
LSQAKVRSTTQRRGKTSKPFAWSDLLNNFEFEMWQHLGSCLSKSLPLVVGIGREDYYCPKSETEFGIGHPDLALPAPAAKVLSAADLEDVVAILKEKISKTIGG